jgi:hypothetical protein
MTTPSSTSRPAAKGYSEKPRDGRGRRLRISDQYPKSELMKRGPEPLRDFLEFGPSLQPSFSDCVRLGRSLERVDEKLSESATILTPSGSASVSHQSKTAPPKPMSRSKPRGSSG